MTTPSRYMGSGGSKNKASGGAVVQQQQVKAAKPSGKVKKPVAFEVDLGDGKKDTPKKVALPPRLQERLIESQTLCVAWRVFLHFVVRPLKLSVY